jgi:hypothetical protein
MKLRLSKSLNFMHGLGSSCGDKRIKRHIYNQTQRNIISRLDPSRPGRMDMHIHIKCLMQISCKQKRGGGNSKSNIGVTQRTR